MDEIEISPDLVVSMDDIAPGLRGLRIAFVNVFALTQADGSWKLVDAGIPGSQGIIRNWTEKHFPTPPNAIVLTHGHFDHVSAARGLADEWGVPIFAHPLEFPYLTGEKAYAPRNTGAGGGLMSLLSPTYPREPINLGSRLRPLETLPDWEILHTPGHTPGHVSFFREQGIGRCWWVMRFARQSPNLSLKPHWHKTLNCMGHLLISLQIGMPQGGPWNAYQNSNH